MNFSKIVAAAGLTIAIGVFAPSVFAQVAGGVPSGPEITNMGNPPASQGLSGLPIGSASAAYMQSKQSYGSESAEMSGPSATRAEEQASSLEIQVTHDIAAARALGLKVGKAANDRLIGSIALSHGNRPDAIRHFRQAERELHAEGWQMSRNGTYYNESRNNPDTNGGDWTPTGAGNGANLNSNTNSNGTNPAY